MASPSNSSPDSLESFVESVNGESHLRIETDFGDGFVRLRTSEAERRQAAQDIRSSEDIVVELLRNARDAKASHIFVATCCVGSKRSIVVIDDGIGIPDKMHERIFEPRVTSKLDTSHMDKWGLHGRGMALYSIAQNSESSRVVCSQPSKGTSIVIETDTDKLGEKADQSSFPTFTMSEEGTVVVRGPKNIARTVCEFAIEEHADCSVYLGTPSEILATLYAYGVSTLSKVERAFTKNANDLPITKRLALSSDPADFSQTASSIGLAISERTARRILNGAISDVDSMLNRVSIIEKATKSDNGKRLAKSKNRPATKVCAEDREAVLAAALTEYAKIAKQYYLDPDVEGKTSVKNGELTISIPLIEI